MVMATSLCVITTVFVLLYCSSQVTSQSQTLYSPIKKDETTNMYSMLIYLKTPLQPSQLHLDLGSYIPYYDCARHYKSSSYSPVVHNSSLCIDLNTLAYGNCFRKPGPGCANDTCFDFPQNPVTQKGGIGSIQTDKFTLPVARKTVQLGPVCEIVLSCTEPNKYAKAYRGLAKGSTGVAALGRFNHSLSAQISRVSGSPWIFSLCLPGSSNRAGVALFNSPGPYNFNPNIDVSKSLVYAPLILGPRGADTDVYYWYKSPDYYVGLTSFMVNGKAVPLNRTLLAVDGNGRGGTKISTSRPYGVLQSSIYRALTDAFAEEMKSYRGVDRTLAGPFGACYKMPSTRVGPDVPAVDLVIGKGVIWRIHGSNSMVRIERDLWCLGFVDGGPNPRTSVVIGGHQIEDTLVEFDLEKGRIGFSSSLLVQNTTCADFRLKNKYSTST